MKPNLKIIGIVTCVLAGTARAGHAPPAGPDFSQGRGPALHLDRELTAAEVRTDILPVDVIPFAFDRSAVTPLDLIELGDAARWLDAHPGFTLVVESHADAHGSSAHNAVLSARRALVVRDWLIELGAPPDRVMMVSCGEAQPIARDPFASSNRVAVVYATPRTPAAVARSMRARGAAVLRV